MLMPAKGCPKRICSTPSATHSACHAGTHREDVGIVCSNADPRVLPSGASSRPHPMGACSACSASLSSPTVNPQRSD